MSPRRPDAAAGSGKFLYSFAQIQHLARIEFGRAQRYAYPLVAMEIAIDRLGHLRDVLGFEAKQAVVDAATEVIARQTRASDLLGRLPDDRLLLLVPHVAPHRAEILARRLLDAARSEPIHHADRTLEMTLSIGGSWFAEDETMFADAVLEAAGAALAEAIAAGGDRYVGRAPGKARGGG